MPLTPNERRLASQIAAHTSWARTEDRTARTRAGREAREAKFLEEAEGDPIRAAHLRKAFYARMALTSVQCRRKAKEATAAAEAAESELASLGGSDSGDAA
jgi:hypothetical protein